MDSVFVSRAAITKYHRLDGLNNRSRGWKSQIKIQKGLVSDESSFPGLHMSTFLRSPHIVLPLSMCRERKSSLTLVVRQPVLVDQGLTLMISCNHNYLPRTLSPNTVKSGVRTSTYEFWKDTLLPTASSRRIHFRKKEIEYGSKEWGVKTLVSKETGKHKGKSKQVLTLKSNTDNSD